MRPAYNIARPVHITEDVHRSTPHVPEPAVPIHGARMLARCLVTDVAVQDDDTEDDGFSTTARMSGNFSTPPKWNGYKSKGGGGGGGGGGGWGHSRNHHYGSGSGSWNKKRR